MTLEGESTKTLADAAQKDQSPTKDVASTSTKTYTDEDVKKAVSDALAEQGRKHKSNLDAAVKKARDSIIKEQEENDTERKDIEKMISELAGDDDPDKKRLAQYLKDNKKMKQELEERWKANEARILKAEEIELTELCRTVAGEYEGSDPAKLARIAKRTKFDDSDIADQIRDLADELWTKKSAKPAQTTEPPRKIDSGITTGNTTGRKPSLEELRALRDKDGPEAVLAKFKSGEWLR